MMVKSRNSDNTLTFVCTNKKCDNFNKQTIVKCENA